MKLIYGLWVEVEKKLCFSSLYSDHFGVIVLNIGPVCALEVTSLNHIHDFQGDLELIRKTLFENHPGMCNVLDPTFSETLELQEFVLEYLKES